ncbi:MAG TPA: hypothetical protein VGS20_06035 [Candidatus Acidoferrales bacterium]|nr:hypothetical protein [Candidatus Acidoferrales bacterium]
MRSSLEEAIPIFSKWKDTAAGIVVLAEGTERGDESRWLIRLEGRITEVFFSPKERSARVLLEGESQSLRLSLTDALVEYQDPREAPLPTREEAFSNVVCSLSVRLPEGESFILYERLGREEGLR